jgi:hypothetical protein
MTHEWAKTMTLQTTGQDGRIGSEAVRNALALNERIVSITLANFQSGLRFAQGACAVSTPWELGGLTMRHMREQCEASAEQMAELAALSRGFWPASFDEVDGSFWE